MKPSGVKQLRSDLGWSQAQLAQHLGYTQNAINRWEHGLSAPPDLTKSVLWQMRKQLDQQIRQNQKQEFVDGLKKAAITAGIAGLLVYLFSDD